MPVLRGAGHGRSEQPVVWTGGHRGDVPDDGGGEGARPGRAGRPEQPEGGVRQTQRERSKIQSVEEQVRALPRSVQPLQPGGVHLHHHQPHLRRSEPLHHLDQRQVMKGQSVPSPSSM